MRKQIFVLVLLSIALTATVFAQGRLTGKLVLGTTVISSADLKVGEPLVTHDGVTIPVGVYRISITVNARGEGQFMISPFKLDKPPAPSGLTKNAVNRTADDPNEGMLFMEANINRNTFVKGVASHIEGDFKLENVSPTETELSFNSKEFGASTMLGRSPDSKTVDLLPTFVGLQNATPCGDNCIEGNVKVIVRNDGNSTATGKWNVTLSDPRFYVGSVSDVAGGGEKEIVSANKLKLTCCGATAVDVDVHADFYNKESRDAMESNNIKRFTLRLGPQPQQ
ncbi:MAG: hypothetical protein C5B54_07190 [Acidobacteria bacterium]|nr:MAG: hypothetical protein C5B54_07190 [Acidobacteriota bacterium]